MKTLSLKAYLGSINIKRSFRSNLKLFLYQIGFGHLLENQSTISYSKLIKAICRVCLTNIYLSGEIVCIMMKETPVVTN